MSTFKRQVLDHGYVELRNLAGPTRRLDQEFDAHDRDPANSARFSFDDADKDRSVSQDYKLAEYLLKNHHDTPFEMIVCWLEMQLPIVVARQFVRHRTVSINEVSARYVELPNQFYLPDTGVIGSRGDNAKQGRDTGAMNPNAEWFRMQLSDLNSRSYDLYDEAIKKGIPPEVARNSLNVNVYTKWLWKQDLRNMMHFLKLRMHEHAQYEARMYAQAVYDLLKEHLPETMNLFDKYMKS